jgi:LytR cell envelope-related transcriptional attenuator
MESPAAPIAELVRWQTATLIAAAVAAVELVVLVVLGVALLAGPAADKVRAVADDRAASTPPSLKLPPKPKPEPARLARSRTRILVLNGNGVTGAAAGAAEQVRGLGYRIGTVGNAERSDYPQTLVMFRRGRRGEALRLAKDLRTGVVAPLDGLRPSDLGGAHVVLLLGRG